MIHGYAFNVDLEFFMELSVCQSNVGNPGTSHGGLLVVRWEHHRELFLMDFPCLMRPEAILLKPWIFPAATEMAGWW